MTKRINVRELDATGYVGDGEQYLADDGTWKVPAGGGLPTGGTAGQVLTKQSSVDGDADWATPSGGGGGGATAWTTLPLASGFVSNDASFGYPPQYRMVGDEVQLHGVLKRSTGAAFAISASVLIATLPTGFRPPAIGTSPMYLLPTFGSSNVLVRWDLKSDGTVNYFISSGSTTWITLDGLRFSTAS